MTLGSGWNIPVDLIIGPHVGISYLTHPQAKPITVTDFNSIKKIVSSVLSSKSDNGQIDKNRKENENSNDNLLSKKMLNACDCVETKTLLKIKVDKSTDDLIINCNDIKTANSIADLVDGYCRIVNNMDVSYWERLDGSNTNENSTGTLEKQKHASMALPMPTTSQQCKESNVDETAHSAGGDANDLSAIRKPILNEDYVDIGLCDDEGDYSTPAARNYELDRSQIVLNEIIGVGQFGDVHIGLCSLSKSQKANINNQNDGYDKDGDNEVKTIQVAVKTCKADADMMTSEKFLEEACKFGFLLKIFST